MKIIINADDFGISPKVNKSIYESAKSGYITSSTIMAIGPSLDEAIEMSHELNDISLGIHLTFDDDFSSLTGQPKFFNQNSIVNIRRINLFKLDIITDEFSKQIEKLLNKNLNISHIDTHHHIHLYPLVLTAILKISSKYKIKKIRSQKLVVKKSWFNKSYRLAHHNITEVSGLIQPSFYTDFSTFINKNIYSKNSDDICEIMCHPGSRYNDEEYFKKEIYDTFRGSLINYHQLV